MTDPDVAVAHGTSGVNDDKSVCLCLVAWYLQRQNLAGLSDRAGPRLSFPEICVNNGDWHQLIGPRRV